MDDPRSPPMRPHVAPLFAAFVAMALSGIAGANPSPDAVVLSPAQAAFPLEPPRIVSVFPADGSVDVSVSADIEIVFSEGMDRSSVEAALSYTDGVRVWTKANGTFLWSRAAVEDDRVVFSPYQNFPFLVEIAVTLDGTLARDLDGSPVGGIATWTFQTEAKDRWPPTVWAVVPEPGAVEVSEATGIAITFSEPMNRTTVEDAFSLSDGVRTWTKGNGTFAWTRGDDVVTYDPASNLAFDRTYTVRVAASSKDVNNNTLDGNGNGLAGDEFLSTFRTRAEPDFTPPHVASTDPKDETVGVPRNRTISITFDDPMSPAATRDAIWLQRVEGYDAVALPLKEFSWSAANHTVSFQSASLLDWGAWHRVTVTQFARNEAGLPLEKTYVFQFRTATWTGTVVGRVVDEAGGVEGTTVALGNTTTQSTETGTFTFPGVKEGTYELTVVATGYEPVRVAVTISRADADAMTGTIDLGEIVLQPAPGVSPLVVAGMTVLLAGGLAAILWWRRRRQPPLELEEPEDEYLEPEP